MKFIQRTIGATLVSVGIVLATGCAVENGVLVFNPNALFPDYQVQAIKQKAGQGDAIAQFTLGSCYATGRGVVRDHVEAVQWYRRSAEQGYAPAQYRLGFSYEIGSGVVRDNTEAAQWYRKAAEQGNAPAQYRLSICYATGRGVARDRAEAVNWCSKAAERGNLAAQNYLRILENRGVAAASGPSEAAAQNPPAVEPNDQSAQDPPLTVDEIKSLSGSGVKAEVLIAQIKETKARFSSQDINAAQQANPPVDPEVIKCMKENLR